MKKEIFKRGAALVLGAVMTISILPPLASIPKVEAAVQKTKTVSGLGIDGIINPYGSDTSSDDWKGNYVYYGKYKESPIRYRVLDTDSKKDFQTGTDSMLLDCESGVEVLYYDVDASANDWKNSDVYKWMNSTDPAIYNAYTQGNMSGFLRYFSDAEQAAIVSSNKQIRSGEDGKGEFAPGAIKYYKFVPLTGEKVFALDEAEITNKSYGYPNSLSTMKQRGKNNVGWYFLRSGYGSTSTRYHFYDQVNCVDSEGAFCDVTLTGAADDKAYGYANPAFNIDTNKVLFNSLVEGTAGKYGAAYKLTMLDNNIKLAVTSSSTTKSGNIVAVPYNIYGSNGTSVNQLSYLVTNKQFDAEGAKIRAYGKIASVSGGKAGNAKLNLAAIAEQVGGGCTADTLFDNYMVYLVAESVQTDRDRTTDINEGLFTDLASTPVLLSKPANEGMVADDDKTVIENGTSGIDTPYGSHPGETLDVNEEWKGSYVYYGQYNGEPVKYRVLDTASGEDFKTGTDSMLLDCDEQLIKVPILFSSGTVSWEDSNMYKWLNNESSKNDANAPVNCISDKIDGFLYGFSDTEKETIVASTKTGKNAKDGDTYFWSGDDEISYMPITNEKVFALDLTEAANTSYGYPNTYKNAAQRSKTGTGWGCRTTYQWISPGTANGFPYAFGYSNTGAVGMSVTASPFYPSPAFNIDKKDILFTTLVDGTAGKTGASYKFTLLDSGMNVQITDSVITKTGNTITIPYEITGKKKDNVSQLSYFVTDKVYNADGAKIKAYGKLTDVSSNLTGSLQMDLASVAAKIGNGCTADNLFQSYKVYIVAEDISADDPATMGIDESLFTDYASMPVILSNPVSADDSKQQQVEMPVAEKSADGTSLILSSKTAGATIIYTIDGTTPSASNGTVYNGPIKLTKDSTTITAIAGKDGMNNSKIVQVIVLKVAGKITQITVVEDPKPGESKPDTPAQKQETTSVSSYVPGTKKFDNWVKSDAVDKYTMGQLTGRASATTKTVTLRWENVKGADGYIIYGNYCNTKKKVYKYNKIKTVSAKKFKNKKNVSCKVTKIAGGKKLKKNTFYKFKVIAYKNVKDAKTGKTVKKAIGKSYQLHTITATKKYKYSNPTAVVVKTTKKKTVSKVTVKKKKSVLLEATVKMPKGKKLKRHCEKIRWFSTNKKIATVTQAGRIKGKKKGKCYVYAIAQNGARKVLKVTVK